MKKRIYTVRIVPRIRDRLKSAWKRNRGVFLCMGIGCIIMLFLLHRLLWRPRTDALEQTVVEITIPAEPKTAGVGRHPGAPLPSEVPMDLDAVEISPATSPTATPSPTPEPTPSPTPEPTLAPTPTPAPDFDKLVSFYKLEAEQYYNDGGYSSNHYDYTEDELHILAQVIYGEARGESTEGKIAVANVVMNRVLSRGYPGKTIKDVVTAPGQFTGYSPSIRPNAACISVARQVLDYEVWVIPQHVYFFHSKKGLPDGENWGTHKFYKRIGMHAFYTESYRGRNRSGKIPSALYERAYKWPQHGCEPGKRVYRIQYMLNKLGYDVKADSYFGKTSKDALMAFQKDRRIKADGVAGPSTIKALIKAFGVDAYRAKFSN